MREYHVDIAPTERTPERSDGRIAAGDSAIRSSGRQSDIEEQKNGEVTENEYRQSPDWRFGFRTWRDQRVKRELVKLMPEKILFIMEIRRMPHTEQERRRRSST